MQKRYSNIFLLFPFFLLFFLMVKEIPIFICFSFFYPLRFSIFLNLHYMQKVRSCQDSASFANRLKLGWQMFLNRVWICFYMSMKKWDRCRYTDKRMRKFYVHEWTFRPRYIPRIHHRGIAAKRIKVRSRYRRNFSEKPFFRAADRTLRWYQHDLFERCKRVREEGGKSTFQIIKANFLKKEIGVYPY